MAARRPRPLTRGDSVDAVIADWAAARPDLPVAPVEIITRIGRIRSLLDVGLQHVFDRYDLSAADFAVIVSLRRAQAPHRLPQTELASRLGLTAGTISVRIDRLVGRGVVVRELDAVDRRVQLVRLTPDGLALFDEIAPVHLANEDRLLTSLSDRDRDALSGLLRRLLASLERTSVQVPSLGLELAEAHVARARRAELGLSDPPGLLVLTAPTAGSPAAAAGLAQGDLLLRLDAVELRSCLDLARRLAPSRPRTVRVAYLRGETPGEVVLRLGPGRRPG